MIALALIAALAAPGSPRDVAERLYRAFNAHDPGAMAKLYAPDARLISPDYCTVRGAGDVVRTYRGLFTAIPDVRDEVAEMVVSGDRVVVRFTSHGTVQGAPFKLDIANFLTVRNGLIVEDRDIHDTGGRPCEP